MSAAPHRPKLVDLSRIVCLGAALSLTGACDLDEVDIKTQDGKAPQVEDSLGKKVVTTPDGAQYTVKPGGTIVDAEGNKTKIKRDGTIVQPDGTRVNIYGDGTKATMKVETIELGADGEKVLVHADGTRTILKADGTSQRIYKDGTKTTLQTVDAPAPAPGASDKPEGGAPAAP
ncbi:MAG: hypothetical protein IPK80_11480 [Nannocystis sp.]|nr:hypothetical protein [Nannocystis sp.]